MDGISLIGARRREAHKAGGPGIYSGVAKRQEPAASWVAQKIERIRRRTLAAAPHRFKNRCHPAHAQEGRLAPATRMVGGPGIYSGVAKRQEPAASWVAQKIERIRRRTLAAAPHRFKNRYHLAQVTRILIVAVICAMCSITAQRSSAEPPAPREHPTPGLASATMGGKQTWGDELVFHGWRIQRSALTDRCRLLDENDRRVRSGTFDECRQDLERIKRERELPPLGKKAVVLLHGLMRSRDSMVPLGDYLGKHGYEVVYVGYPSTRASVGDHARALAKVVRNLDGVEEINFVAHSLGNLVVRHYLYDETDPATGRHPDARIHRFVEIGPPNQQPGRARWWDQNDNLRGLFHVVAGASGRELGDDWAALEPHLATPACEFGILAGGKGDERGFDQSIPGDDDGTLAVFETRLTGARDFLLVPVLHTFLPEDRRVQRYTLNFLQHGCFTSENERRPIVARRVMIER